MKINKAPKNLWKDPLDFMAAGFGFGAMPFAPGTFGTIVAIPLYYWLSHFALPFYIAIIVALFVVGIFLCHRAGKHFGQVDHSAIVWDEIVGFLIVMIAIPPTWYYIVAGFVLFRFLDIVKPWPIRWIERKCPGGLGVMLDDVLAGIIAWIILFLASQFF